MALFSKTLQALSPLLKIDKFALFLNDISAELSEFGRRKRNILFKLCFECQGLRREVGLSLRGTIALCLIF